MVMSVLVAMEITFSLSAPQPIRTLWRWCSTGWREAVPSWSVRPALHMLSSNGICREITATAGKRWAATECVSQRTWWYQHIVFVSNVLKCIFIPFIHVKHIINVLKYWIGCNFTDMGLRQMSISSDGHEKCLLDISIWGWGALQAQYFILFCFFVVMERWGFICSMTHLKNESSRNLCWLSVNTIKRFRFWLSEGWFLTRTSDCPQAQGKDT